MQTFLRRLLQFSLLVTVLIFATPLLANHFSDSFNQATLHNVNTPWVEIEPIINGVGVADDSFGHKVAIDGDTAVVGDSAGLGDDAAYVYVRQDDEWVLQQKLTPSIVDANHFFGRSVAIADDTIVVGASGYSINFYEPGAIYIFTRSGTTWTEQALLVPSDGADLGLFGYSVAIDDDTAVAGAYTASFGGVAWQGNAYVFKRNGTTWEEQQKLVASDGAEFDNFGVSVDIDNQTIVVGAYGNHGAAYIFEEAGSTWIEQQKLVDSGMEEYDSFGISVAVDEDTIAVGHFMEDNGDGTNQGALYLYHKDGGSWGFQTKLVASDGADSDYFGYSASISGDKIIVGSYLSDIDGQSAQGAAYIFKRGDNEWHEEQKLTAVNGAENDYLGISVAIDENTAVAGAHGADIGANEDQGCVFVFEREQNRRLFLPFIANE